MQQLKYSQLNIRLKIQNFQKISIFFIFFFGKKKLISKKKNFENFFLKKNWFLFFVTICIKCANFSHSDLIFQFLKSLSHKTKEGHSNYEQYQANFHQRNEKLIVAFLRYSILSQRNTDSLISKTNYNTTLFELLNGILIPWY